MGQRGPRSSNGSHRSRSEGDDELRTGPASDRRRAAFEARQRREAGETDASSVARTERTTQQPGQRRGNSSFDRSRVDREDRSRGSNRDHDGNRARTRRNAPNRGVGSEHSRDRRGEGRYDDRARRGRNREDGEFRADRYDRSGRPDRDRSGRSGQRRQFDGQGDSRGPQGRGRRFGQRDDRRSSSDGRRREAGGFQRSERFDRDGTQRFVGRREDGTQGFDRRSDRRLDSRSPRRSNRDSAPSFERPQDGVTAEPEIWIDEGVAHDATNRSQSRRGRRGPVNQPINKSRNDSVRRDNRAGSPKQSPKRGTKRDRSDSLIVVDKVVLAGLTGNKERAEKLARRIKRAASSFESEYYDDARRTLAPIVKEVPDFADLRELNGLVMYRLGRWRDAIRELEAFRQLSPGSTEQHPVLADSYRAIGRHHEVSELWDELRTASPSGELVDEGRIVMAGSLADQGEFSSAIRLLSKGFKLPKNAQDRHLRRGYVLADLYERVGDLPQARELFGRIARVEPDFVDVNERLRNLY